MSETQYVKGITAENLRTFLELWAQLMPGIEEAMQSIIENNDLLFDENAGSFSWCYLYELPIVEHVSFNFSGLLPEEQVINWRKQVAESPGKIAALPSVAEQINNHFDSRANPSKEDIKALRPFLSTICAYFYSVQYSLLKFHAFFMNR